MSTKSSVSMHELELESAELLPTRETLCVTRCHPSSHGGSYSYSSYSQSASANTAQVGLLNVNIPIASGDNFNLL